jgi:hypothetical protein
MEVVIVAATQHKQNKQIETESKNNTTFTFRMP